MAPTRNTIPRVTPAKPGFGLNFNSANLLIKAPNPAPKNDPAVVAIVLNMYVGFFKSLVVAGTISFKLPCNLWSLFGKFPSSMALSRISFDPGNSRGNPRITIAQTKIPTPVAMYANHQAPIHCGCLEVKLTPSGYCLNKLYMLVKESINVQLWKSLQILSVSELVQSSFERSLPLLIPQKDSYRQNFSEIKIVTKPKWVIS